MNKLVALGLAGVALVWGFVALVKRFGVLDLVVTGFAGVSLVVLGLLTLRVLRGGVDG